MATNYPDQVIIADPKINDGSYTTVTDDLTENISKTGISYAERN